TLITDIWSSCTMTSFITITCHFIDENWNLCHLLLDVFEIPSPYTALTSNNASNIVLASSIVQDTLTNNFANTSFQHIQCAAHIMNLAVKKGLNIANRYLIKLCYFIKKIRKFPLLIEDLK
ncbi:37142_t:CDS:2, partial [Gigaspora margarita]